MAASTSAFYALIASFGRMLSIAAFASATLSANSSTVYALYTIGYATLSNIRAALRTAPGILTGFRQEPEQGGAADLAGDYRKNGVGST